MSKKEKLKAEHRKAARIRIKGKAYLRKIRMSARKIRLIADLIRNKKVEYVISNLLFQQKSSVKPIISVLDSAIANAVSKGAEVEKLYISEIQIDKAAIQKRFMSRAQGRSTRIRKQTAHISIHLNEEI